MDVHAVDCMFCGEVRVRVRVRATIGFATWDFHFHFFRAVRCLPKKVPSPDERLDTASRRVSEQVSCTNTSVNFRVTIHIHQLRRRRRSRCALLPARNAPRRKQASQYSTKRALDVVNRSLQVLVQVLARLRRHLRTVPGVFTGGFQRLAFSLQRTHAAMHVFLAICLSIRTVSVEQFKFQSKKARKHCT